MAKTLNQIDEILDIVEAFGIVADDILSMNFENKLPVSGGPAQFELNITLHSNRPIADVMRSKYKFEVQHLLPRTQVTAHHLDGGVYTINIVLI
jgi:hypothetical protein